MRVLKWAVPVDDHQHLIGLGEVIHVDTQDDPAVVYVWTIEDTDPGAPQPAVPSRPAVVIGTGHEVPPSSEHLGSVVVHLDTSASLMATALGGSSTLVWHVFAEVQS